LCKNNEQYSTRADLENMLSNQSRTSNKGWSSAWKLVVEWKLNEFFCELWLCCILSTYYQIV